MPKQQIIDKEIIDKPDETDKLPLEIPPESILKVEEGITEDDLEISSTPSSTITLSRRDIVEQKAKGAREARLLPPVPGYAPSLEQAIEWFKLLDDDMWSHLAPYVYRMWPKICRQLSDSDNKNYIDLLCKEHVDSNLMQYLIDTHGGGTYKMMVTDLDKKGPGGHSTTIMNFQFRIDSNTIEPKLNLKEIDVNHKPNMGFINKMVSKGLMDAKGNIMITPQQVGTNGNPAELAGEIGKIYQTFMSQYTTMGKEQQATINKMLADSLGRKGDDSGVTALLLEKLKQDDPNKQTSTMLQMITTIMGIMPKHDDGNGMIALLIKQMNDSNERMMVMVNKMFEMKSEPKEDFFDKFIKYRTVAPEIFGSSGNERPIKRETAEIIVEGVKELGLPLLGIASQFLQMKGFNPIIPVTEQQAQDFVRSNPSQPGQQQQNPIQHLKVLPMPSPNQQQQPGQPMSLDPNNLTVAQKLIIQFGGILITKIKANVDGGTLADELEAATPIIGNVYGKLKSEGAEEILKAMESIPEFWNETGKVYGKDHMVKLVEEFLMDPPSDDEGGEDEEERLPIGNGKEGA